LLLETAMPRVRSFCGTVTILLGNVLALMLTLLSMSKGTDVELKWAHYQCVKQIAFRRSHAHRGGLDLPCAQLPAR
jgi:hypothetical protein